MKVKVLTNEFVAGIEKVAQGRVKGKTQLPILKEIKCIIEDNKLILQSTNLIQNITTKLEVLDSDFKNYSFVLDNTESLIKAVKYFENQYINIDIESNDIIINCGNKKIKQTITDAKEFPMVIDNIEGSEYEYNIDKLKNRFNAVKYAVAKDNIKPIFMGVNFNKNDMVAVDGYRLALNTSNELYIEKSCTVPTETLKLATDVLNDNIKIIINDENILITDNKTTVMSKLLKGTYLKYDSFFDKESEEIHSINNKDFIKELKYLKNFATDKNKMIIWDKGNIEVNNENGIYESKLETEKTGTTDIKIGFNCEYMIDILGQFKDSKNVKINFVNNLSPIIVEDENKNNKAFILSIRVA